MSERDQNTVLLDSVLVETQEKNLLNLAGKQGSPCQTLGTDFLELMSLLHLLQALAAAGAKKHPSHQRSTAADKAPVPSHESMVPLNLSLAC
mmetsp:Transcript_5942/g.14431  ORF Transcript_5942/g.14431 Transcript_5942/m.14431 type:complete len:92 (-) Transcript_5942:96-371(-)